MANDSGGPAFPVPGDQQFAALNGMTLRDWFAGQALAGVLSGYWANPEVSGFSHSDFANEAYLHADAMLAERAK